MTVVSYQLEHAKSSRSKCKVRSRHGSSSHESRSLTYCADLQVRHSEECPPFRVQARCDDVLVLY